MKKQLSLRFGFKKDLKKRSILNESLKTSRNSPSREGLGWVELEIGLARGPGSSF